MYSLPGGTTPEDQKKITAVTIVTPWVVKTPPGQVPEKGAPPSYEQFESAIESDLEDDDEETPPPPKTPPEGIKDPSGKFDVGPNFFYQKTPVNPNTK